MKLSRILLVVLLMGWQTAVASETRDPEADTGRSAKSLVRAESFMVSTANPYATKAGYDILKKGGTAVDAAIAVQMVLTLVEPQSSGIGGGAFALVWDNKNRKLITYDGRETAPQAVEESLFLDDNGNPLNWWQALAGGRSVGVPGVPALLKKVHERYGRLPWETLFQDAIRLSMGGFKVSERLHQLVAKRTNPALGRYDEAWRYFFPNGSPVPTGTMLKNPVLADTLKRIALMGPSAFYKGDIALDMVRVVRSVQDNPGFLTVDDLSGYRAKQRPPVCAGYRGYKVCGMGPPTSGGMTVIQILTMLESWGLQSMKPLSPKAVHLFTQAARLAYADRAVYMADSDFVPVPVKGLTDPGYLSHRADLIDPESDIGKAAAGKPPGIEHAFAPADSPEQPGTSHFSIVDAEGNAVSMTTSIEMAFGSTLMTRGFLLNNQLTDFSFLPDKNGAKVANRVQGGKRPRSSMSPMMVFDSTGNRLVMIIGSPGGSRIINYVAKTIIAVLDWKLDIQTAIDLPHFVNRNGVTDLESGTAAASLKDSLIQMGHKIRLRELNSGLHGIVLRKNGLEGGADSRREGLVMGK